jgi:hypothetical protein
MSLHDELARKALSMGRSATDFKAAAQKHANATWIFLLVAGVVWYFFRWELALIPLAIAIYTAIKSVSATRIAIRIGKLRQNSSVDEDGDIDEEPVSIVQAYSKVLQDQAPAAGCVADLKKLPYPKSKIKAALITVLRMTDDPKIKEALRIGYIYLSSWQDGVGGTDQGLDLTNVGPNQSPEELAKSIIDNSTKDWGTLMLKEQEVLKQELVDLGLW